MATEGGRTDPSVADRLFRQPWDFEFFQAVRLLASLYGKDVLAKLAPAEEAVRFHAHVSLLFPACSIQAIRKEGEGSGRLLMTVNFMGLAGPAGILPVHYTEHLIAGEFEGDTAAAAFFDLFNHRLISLLYMGWQKHRFPIGYERQAQSPSRFTGYLFDLIGMGTRGLQKRLEVKDQALLLYAGLIAQRPHTAISLAGILMDYFQVEAEVIQFVGRWFVFDDDCLSRLDGRGDYGRLGAGAVAGVRVWNQQAAFRVRLGPLRWTRFQKFLPGSRALTELKGLVRYYVDRSFEFEVQLILRASDVPLCRLGSGADSPRLGLSTWLKTSPFREDAGDPVMRTR